MTENPSDKESSTGSGYAELLTASSAAEVEENPWEVKLALWTMLIDVKYGIW